MTIKSDRWIRKMALEHGMIRPFEEKQVREGVVSYGLSSYGYDVRVADEFKVFTNVNSMIIDPKKFDTRSFVDVKGDCIVPPNSFALARTVEYLKIPRNVLTVCLGKCVTGDTRVVDADTGEYLPIREFAGRKRTVGLDGWRTAVQAVTDWIPQGRKPVFELVTASGLSIRATAEHPFRQPHRWTPLSQLRPGDRIAAAARVPVFGTTPLAEWQAASLARAVAAGEVTSVPSEVFQAPEEGARTFLHTLFAAIALTREAGGLELVGARRLVEDLHHLLLRFGIAGALRPEPWRLELAPEVARRFAQRIEQATPAVERARAKRARSGGDPLEESGVTVLAELVEAGEAGLDGGPLWDPVVSIAPAGEEEVFDLTVPGAESFLANGLLIHNSTYARCFSADTRVALVDGTAPTLEEMARRSEQGEQFWGYAMGEHGRIVVALLDKPRFIGRDSLLELGLDDGATIRCTPDHEIMRRDGGLTPAAELVVGDSLMPLYRTGAPEQARVYQPLVAGTRNHRVASIRPLTGEHDVYCLTVPEAGNFALEAGVFVRNCGIIVNVTPFEPEWEGYATLEISNTTPLPAKIYANEGLCQVLFFESDEPCETSYADKGGKYQKQPAQIVLPRM